MHLGIATALLPLCLILNAFAAPAAPGTGTPNAPSPTPHVNTTPRITGIAPGSGAPQSSAVISASNVPSDPAKAEVWFTLAANNRVQARINSITPRNTWFEYRVSVPGDDSLLAPYTGPVTILDKDTGKATAGYNFKIIPTQPRISSHSPQYGRPGATTHLRGEHFSANDVLTIDGVGTVSHTLKSATELQFTLPASYPLANKLIRLKLTRKGVSGVAPATYMYSLDPSLKAAEPNKDTNGGSQPKSEPKSSGGGKSG